MAILHFSIGGPRLGVTASERARYIGIDLPHFSRGRLELVESGNLPRFATNDASAFWLAVDQHERLNARLFTEIELALPLELDHPQRIALAREAVHAILGLSFAYTMAIHMLLDSEGREQRHLHLMFSERPVTDHTTSLLPEVFLKRNGAKKDSSWNKPSKPFELRVLWCGLLNTALATAGVAITFSPQRQTNQPVEPKILSREGRVDSHAASLAKSIRTTRRTSSSLVEECERQAQKQIDELENRLDADLRHLEVLIAEARLGKTKTGTQL